MIAVSEIEIAQADTRKTVSRRPPNELEAEAALREAIIQFGSDSVEADCAWRHLDIVRRFNERYGWGTC
ncbi:MAG: hypothetical protein MI920_06300 [Kiloniellales bacterium]|nr:hypothetical protein [Kiloniellales bacterium]